MRHVTNFFHFRTGGITALLVLLNLFCGFGAQAQITTVSELTNAVNNGAANAQIVVGAGTFELTAPLRPKAGMTIKGAGKGKTIITGASSWNPGTADLPDGETDARTRNRNAYLFDLDEGVKNVTISDMTLKGPQLHGAVLGFICNGLELYNLHVENFLWSGIRIFVMDSARIHDNTFVDAADKQKGVTGGAFFLTYTGKSEFWNNEISYSAGSKKEMYGFKGRSVNNIHLHHNTVKVDFSVEFPFESEEFVEIDHNYLAGVISIPKYAGGPVPQGGYTFHIHHNYFTTPYAMEWPRNGIEVDHNLFNFREDTDYGNLISNFVGDPPSPGPTKFHDNNIKNPGRGVMWNAGPYNNFSFYNNHVIANKTITPRTEGFFEFPESTDFSTIAIRDNIIECTGLARPLMRNTASYAATISNNKLVNVSDTDKYSNPQTGAVQGPLEKLNFTLGAYNKYTINQWQILGDDRETASNPTTEQTIFTTQVPTGFDREAQYELGTVFKATVDGTVTKVRIYTNDLEAGEHTVRIWRVADASVVAGPYSWNFSAGTAGWKEFTLPTALKIAAQTDYIVAVSNSADNRYYAFDEEGLREGATNGKNLLAYGRSGVSTKTIGTMPTGVYKSINYFRDVVFMAAPPASSGTGLSAVYYDNKDFTGSTITRTDATVDFDWGTGAPATGMGIDEFSVKWQGQVEAPVTGNYTFSTTSDDGVRLWVNGRQVINNWTDHGPTTDKSSSISLVAGTKYDIRMEYYENWGGAVAKLSWRYPNQSRQVIPSRWLYPTTSTGKQAALNQARASQTKADIVASDISLYPNPGNSQISVRHTAGMLAKVTILDGVGRVVCRQTNINNEQVNINTSGLKQGSYYVKVETSDGQTEVKKLLIEK